MSDWIDELCARVDTAARNKTPVRPVGGASKDFYGGPLDGETVDMRAHSGIVEYEPTELVITAKSGTPLSLIENTLAAQGQELAFEPPRFSADSTLGGAIASGLSGPARLAKGPVKDYLLGCTLLDGKAQVLHFGGVVMKNVAGYDVSRLMAGSLGTLGILLDVSVKVLPKAVSEATLVFDWAADKANLQVNQWLSTPLPINASAHINGRLYVRLRGAQAALRNALQTMGGEVLNPDEAQGFWVSLRDQTHPFFTQPGPLWRLAVAPTGPMMDLPGEQLIEWAGGQRWYKPHNPELTEADLTAVRGCALQAKGHATLYRSHNPALRNFAFQAPEPVVMTIQRRLKQQFDPAGIFSMGRLAPII